MLGAGTGREPLKNNHANKQVKNRKPRNILKQAIFEYVSKNILYICIYALIRPLVNICCHRLTYVVIVGMALL